MKNYFLLQRDLKREILFYVALNEEGVDENEIVKHVNNKFNLFGSWLGKTRDMAKKLAKEGKLQKYIVKYDGSTLNWYVDHDAGIPAWIFALTEGRDWTL